VNAAHLASEAKRKQRLTRLKDALQKVADTLQEKVDKGDADAIVDVGTPVLEILRVLHV
jgi:hypothetical protein